MKIRASFLLIFVLVVAMPVTPAMADIAPPEEPRGSNIDPQTQTQVQMVAEKVTYDFVYQRAREEIPWVTADFTMRNQSDAEEHLQVRFPISGEQREVAAGDGTYHIKMPLLENIVVVVDGQITSTSFYTSTGEKPPTFWGPVVWATFDVTFPPDQDVNIQVMYNQPPLIYPQPFYSYILETGSGWFGPIEKAEFFVRMPYTITTENCPYCFEPDAGWIITDNTMYQSWLNLEPTFQDNVHFSIVKPSIWRTILQAREALKERPGDYDTVLNLARACKDAASGGPKGDYRQDEGGQLLVQCTLDAFLEAVRLNPKSIELRKEFISALDWMLTADLVENARELLKQQALAILSIDPSDQDALYIAKVWLEMSPAELPPTYTPTITDTPDPRTPTKVLSPTPKPTQTRTPYPTMKRYPTLTITPTRTRRPTRTATSLPVTPTQPVTISPTAQATFTATLPAPTQVPAAPPPVVANTRLLLGAALALVVGVGLGMAWARKK